MLDRDSYLRGWMGRGCFHGMIFGTIRQETGRLGTTTWRNGSPQVHLFCNTWIYKALSLKQMLTNYITILLVPTNKIGFGMITIQSGFTGHMIYIRFFIQDTLFKEIPNRKLGHQRWRKELDYYYAVDYCLGAHDPLLLESLLVWWFITGYHQNLEQLNTASQMHYFHTWIRDCVTFFGTAHVPKLVGISFELGIISCT